MKLEGLICFSTSKKSFVSKCIRFFRGSEFSHTFVTFGTISDEIVIGEAATFEVRMAPFSRFINPDTTLEVWQLGDINEAKIDTAISESMKLVGKTYGYFQLLGFIWMWIWDRLGIKKHNPFYDGIICSEYTWFYMKQVEYKHLPDQDYPNDVAPDTLRNVLLTDGVSKRVALSPEGTIKLKWSAPESEINFAMKKAENVRTVE